MHQLDELTLSCFCAHLYLFAGVSSAPVCLVQAFPAPVCTDLLQWVLQGEHRSAAMPAQALTAVLPPLHPHHQMGSITPSIDQVKTVKITLITRTQPMLPPRLASATLSGFEHGHSGTAEGAELGHGATAVTAPIHLYQLRIEGEQCSHKSLPPLSLNPLGQKKSGRLVASGQTQMGLSRLIITLPFCCQDCAQGAHECHGWERRREATQSSTRSSQHTFCWGCHRVLFRNAADDRLHQRAGSENFFFPCMIGCFSVPAPGPFNLIGKKRKKK